MNFKRNITAAACACAVLAGGLTAQAGSWVGVSSPKVFQTYVEGVPAAFPSADGQTMYQPILYKDATYIPLRTAGMWMGKNVEWDEETETATLSGTVEKQFPSDQDEAYNKKGLHYLGNSGSAMLRPEFKIVLDGKKLDFTNARGETIYPLVFEDAIYLPLRNIGELTGFEVNWTPGLSVGDGRIFLNTPITDAQETEMIAYVNTLYDKLDKLHETGKELSEGFTEVIQPGKNMMGQTNSKMLLTDTALAESLLPQIKKLAQTVRNTPEPSHDVLGYYYDHIMAKMDIIINNTDMMLERVKSGDLPCMQSNMDDPNVVYEEMIFMTGETEMMFDVENMMQCAQRKRVKLYK